MADISPQPLEVFSRDLKYMLNARYAAAPLRRPTPMYAVAGVAVLAMALFGWNGTSWLQQQRDIPAAHASYPGPKALPADPRDAGEGEYTHTSQPIAKREAPAPTRQLDPHPPISKEPPLALTWKSYTVRRGDTLGRIFRKFSIDIGMASRIVEDDTGAALKKLLPDRVVRLGFDDEGRLRGLRYELDRLQQLVVRIDQPEGVRVARSDIPVRTEKRMVSQSIGSSLFLSASEAGLSDRLIMELVTIFGWDIDFALDIRSGDRFSILYEEMYRDGELIGTGDIIAAEFVNDGEVFHAVRHIDDSGRKQYFDLEGRNLRGTFLKTPMHVSRVTSGFSKRRYHPVLKEWRAHRGVDYGAPKGTPVLATGDGRVHSMGRNGGYGNAIVLRHGGRYSTLYAHLSGFKKGLKQGAAVAQGEVIGYVGSSGLATGPHLHYEFRVNGKHRNPLTYDTPKAAPIADRYRESFIAEARALIERISEERPEQVASR